MAIDNTDSTRNQHTADPGERMSANVRWSMLSISAESYLDIRVGASRKTAYRSKELRVPASPLGSSCIQRTAECTPTIYTSNCGIIHLRVYIKRDLYSEHEPTIRYSKRAAKEPRGVEDSGVKVPGIVRSELHTPDMIFQRS